MSGAVARRLAIASLIGSVLALPSIADAASRKDKAVRVPITGLTGSLQNPWFSPADDRLVVTQFTKRYNEGSSLVRVVAASGGNPLATLGPTDAQSVNLPGSCFSQTGLVTFTSDPTAGDQVFIVPGEGGEARAITQAPIVAFEPSFSPDGSAITFERFRPGRSEIYRVNVDGSGLRRLTSGANDRQPNWSPKGDRSSSSASRAATRRSRRTPSTS